MNFKVVLFQGFRKTLQQESMMNCEHDRETLKFNIPSAVLGSFKKKFPQLNGGVVQAKQQISYFIHFNVVVNL